MAEVAQRCRDARIGDEHYVGSRALLCPSMSGIITMRRRVSWLRLLDRVVEFLDGVLKSFPRSWWSEGRSEGIEVPAIERVCLQTFPSLLPYFFSSPSEETQSHRFCILKRWRDG